MRRNFTTTILADGRRHLATILPAMRRNGLHFEVNIPGFPRFFMRFGPMDRYEVVNGAGLNLPDALVLAVSDAIEAVEGSR